MNTAPRNASLRSALKPILFAAGLSLAGTGVATAGEYRHHDPVASMTERLGLDDSQTASVEAIFERNRPAHLALRERSRDHREAMKALDPASADFSARAQALADEAASLARDRVLQRTRMQSELSAVLRPEQMSKMQEGRRHKGNQKGHHNGHHMGPGKVPGSNPHQDNGDSPQAEES